MFFKEFQNDDFDLTLAEKDGWLHEYTTQT